MGAWGRNLARRRWWAGGGHPDNSETNARNPMIPQRVQVAYGNNGAQLPTHFASHRRTCTDNGTTVACWQRQRAPHPNQANHSPLRKRVKRRWAYNRSTIAAVPQVDNHKSRASALHPRLRDCASTAPLDKSRRFLCKRAHRRNRFPTALRPCRLAYPASRSAAPWKAASDWHPTCRARPPCAASESILTPRRRLADALAVVYRPENSLWPENPV